MPLFTIMKMKVTYRSRLMAEELNAGLEDKPLRCVTNFLYCVFYHSVEEVTYDVFIEKLEEEGFQERLFAWYESYLKEQAELNKKKAEKK